MSRKMLTEERFNNLIDRYSTETKIISGKVYHDMI